MPLSCDEEEDQDQAVLFFDQPSTVSSKRLGSLLIQGCRAPVFYAKLYDLVHLATAVRRGRFTALSGQDRRVCGWWTVSHVYMRIKIWKEALHILQYRRDSFYPLEQTQLLIINVCLFGRVLVPLQRLVNPFSNYAPKLMKAEPYSPLKSISTLFFSFEAAAVLRFTSLVRAKLGSFLPNQRREVGRRRGAYIWEKGFGLTIGDRSTYGEVGPFFNLLREVVHTFCLSSDLKHIVAPTSCQLLRWSLDWWDGQNHREARIFSRFLLSSFSAVESNIGSSLSSSCSRAHV